MQSASASMPSLCAFVTARLLVFVFVGIYSAQEQVQGISRRHHGQRPRWRCEQARYDPESPGVWRIRRSDQSCGGRYGKSRARDGLVAAVRFHRAATAVKQEAAATEDRDGFDTIDRWAVPAGDAACGGTGCTARSRRRLLAADAGRYDCGTASIYPRAVCTDCAGAAAAYLRLADPSPLERNNR